MSQTRFNSNLTARRAVEVRAYQPRLKRPARIPRAELEVRLADLQQNYAQLHTEIFEASQVHRRLCAPRHIRFGDFEIASEIFAVRHLPGDFFSVEEQSDGIVFALGDICGKGLAAGMWTTHLMGLVSARIAELAKPDAIVASVNRDICLMKSVPLASLFLAKLNPITGVVQYCSAGHPPALLLRANGELELLSEGGMLLGVVSGTPYVSGSFVLRSGDVLMIYSDGITESQDCNGEEFGEAMLEAQLRNAKGHDANALLFSVLGAVQDFASTCPLVDDMSLAIIRRDK